MKEKLIEKWKNLIASYREVVLPECIQKKATAYMATGILSITGSILFGIVSLFSGNPSLTFLFPFLIGLCLVGMGVFTKLNIALNGISILEGQCINITEAGDGKLLVLQNFANSNVGINILIQTKTDMVNVIISDKKQMPVPGQHIRLYLPANPAFYKNSQGIIQYHTIYGIEFFVNEAEKGE